MATGTTPHDVRFAFGANWSRFLDGLDDEAITHATESLSTWLGDPSGQAFLDVGCGSGLFSLAARRLGARVVSFDLDPLSVRCGERLRDCEYPNDENWKLCIGSALDSEFMESLGQFDIVYAWGVLHHTGAMWRALELTSRRVAPGGRLLVSLYNDQGRASKYWRAIKRAYNQLPSRLRPVLVGLVWARWLPSLALADLLKGQSPLGRYREYGQGRGMSPWTDWIDWIGGYPFEVATPGEVFRFLRDRGFTLADMRTSPGLGCNEYLFAQDEAPGKMNHGSGGGL